MSYSFRLSKGAHISSFTVSYTTTAGTKTSRKITSIDWTTANNKLTTNSALTITDISFDSGYGPDFDLYSGDSENTLKAYRNDRTINGLSSGTKYARVIGVKNTTVTVSYYKNGGTWSSGSDPYVDTIEKDSISNTTEPSSLLKRDGYRLLGWSTSSTATRTTYGTSDAVGPVSSSLRLYAVWEECPYITLDAGEGRFDTERYAYFHTGTDRIVYFSKYTPTRSGYKLIGWSPNKGATSPSYGPNDYVGPLGTGKYTYYAVWQKSVVTIKLNGNGGKWDDATGVITLTLDVGDTLSFGKYSSVARPGYTHLGWSTSQTATSAAWGVNGSVAIGSTDATYYAVWAKKNIALFYWVSESWDAANIVSGKSISTALTCTRWNNLKARIKEVAEASGGSYAYDEVKKSDPITAAEFNTVRSKIAGLTGATNPPAAVTKNKTVITASLFEGTNSLKGTLNRAITYYNNH